MWVRGRIMRWRVLDANKKPFDGSKTYKLHLPPNVPVNDFWAVTMYDTQTRSQLQTSQPFPTVGSQTKGIDEECRRLLRPLLRTEGAGRQRRQLAGDGPGQELVHDPAHVRPAGALDQQDLAAG